MKRAPFVMNSSKPNVTTRPFTLLSFCNSDHSALAKLIADFSSTELPYQKRSVKGHGTRDVISAVRCLRLTVELDTAIFSVSESVER